MASHSKKQNSAKKSNRKQKNKKIISGHIKKNKIINKSEVKNKSKFSRKNKKKAQLAVKTENKNSQKINKMQVDEECINETGQEQNDNNVGKRKNLTHQLLFCYNKKKKSVLQKQQELKVVQSSIYKNASRKQTKQLPFLESMKEKLMAARFRYLNEQMYTVKGKEAKSLFDQDPEAFEAYHSGYRQQVSRWPLNPLDVIIEKIKTLPSTFVIADFGCGEARLAKSVEQTVHSFDLKAINESVVACDMAHVPLKSQSVDVVVFCLSLMGTNLKDYLIEANRVLKIGGLLKIAEVESRFDDVDKFVKMLNMYGFMKVKKDFSKNLFCFLEAKKVGLFKSKNNLPEISLQPCMYKKR